MNRFPSGDGAGSAAPGTTAGGVALGLLFVVIWGSAFNAARLVVTDWPPLWGLAIRFGLTVPLLAALMLAAGHRPPARADLWRVAAMGVLGTGGYLALSWMASARIASGLVALVAAAAPLFVALGEAALGRRRPPPLAWGGLLLGWLGVAVLGLARAGEAAGDAALGAPALVGFGLALLGAASQAAGWLIFAPARGRIDLWTATAGQSAVSAVLLLLLAPVFEGAPPTTITTTAAWAMAYSVLVVGIGGYGLMFLLLRRLPPATAASLQLLSPPVAALIGWAFLRESLGWPDLFGGGATLLGVALVFRAGR